MTAAELVSDPHVEQIVTMKPIEGNNYVLGGILADGRDLDGIVGLRRCRKVVTLGLPGVTSQTVFAISFRHSKSF
jgi:hypothetical protein